MIKQHIFFCKCNKNIKLKLIIYLSQANKAFVLFNISTALSLKLKDFKKRYTKKCKNTLFMMDFSIIRKWLQSKPTNILFLNHTSSK